MIRFGGERWGVDDIGDLSGRTAIVTGATSGIGYETAVALGTHGAHVVLACRDVTRANRVADMLTGGLGAVSAEVLHVDLASLPSVRQAAARFNAEHSRLDLLVNNAGVMATPFAVTGDAFERQFATNHLGPFAFTGLLCDLLLTTAGSRVVTVSSSVHRIGRLSFPDFQHLDGGHNRWFAYADTKLANLAFTFELDRRLRAAGGGTIAVAAHPGWARTHLAASGPAMGGSTLRTRVAEAASRLGQSAAAGALPVLYAATARRVEGGQYFGPGGIGELYGHPVEVASSRRSRRRADAARLWEASEELTGVRYGIGHPGCGDGRWRRKVPVARLTSTPLSWRTVASA